MDEWMDGWMVFCMYDFKAVGREVGRTEGLVSRMDGWMVWIGSEG